MTMSVTHAPKCAKMRKYRPTEELGSSADRGGASAKMNSKANETGDRGGASAKMNLKAVETCGQRRCFSKALSRTRLIEAPVEIG